MKIIAIGRNYADHIKELGNETPDEPVIFLKPDTAVLKDDAPFYYPSFTKEVHYETEVLVKICKEGKHIDKKFAGSYYEEIGLGIDFTARDIQNQLKAKGLPWEKAKAFNGSAVLSGFVPKSEFNNVQEIAFHLLKNGEQVQSGNTSLMIHDIDAIIAHVSIYFTLKKGDIIFTGTPKGVGEVKIGDRLQGFIEGKRFFDFEVK